MTNPVFKLEEQLSDLRSEQIAYKLTIENPGTCPIRLLSVEPKVPVGARLLEITDTSLAEASARKVELLEELNRLLRQFLWVVSESFRETWIERQREELRKLFSFAGVFHLYFNTKSFQARMRREFDSFAYKIGGASDARSAFDRWMKGTTEHPTITSLFEAKTEQLERVEARMDENDRPGLTTIEPGSFYTATYVLRFSRRLFEPRKYQLAFDATFQSQDATAPQSNSTATNLQISPYPLSLTIIAILAALLGVLIRLSLAGASDPLAEMTASARSGQLLVGPIVALIFFNAYEYTSLGKGLTMSVSWRSALLIGALCGLAQDRILAAMKALLGV